MNKEAKVGALVVAFMLATLVFIVWIKGNPFRQTRTLNVLFDNVHGLSVGSPVEYAGYECGKVKNFRVTPGGIVTEILIGDPKVKIHEGDKFLIIPSSTIASEYQIFVVPYGKPTPEVPNQSTIIGQSAPGMQDFLFQAEEALGNLKVVMGQVQKILLELDSSITAVGPLFKKAGELANNGTLDSIADNLNQSAKSINNVSKNTDNLIKNNSTKIQSSIDNFSRVTAQLDEKLKAIESGKLRSTMDSLQRTSQNLENLSGAVPPEELRKDIKTFTETAEQAKIIMAKIQSPNANEDAPTMVKRSLQRIDRISAGLEASLKSRSLLKVLLSKVPLNAPATSRKPAKMKVTDSDNSLNVSPEGKTDEKKELEVLEEVNSDK